MGKNHEFASGILGLRYLLDIQLEMSSSQLDMSRNINWGVVNTYIVFKSEN